MNNKLTYKFKSFFSIEKNNKIVILSLVINFLVCFVSYSAYIVNGFGYPDTMIEGMHSFTNMHWQLGGCGRWSLVLINDLHANLVFYWLTIIECFIVDWLSAHIINKILNNNNKVLYCISCALFSILPPIISMYTFNYQAFPCHLAILLSVVFVYLNLENNIYLSILASICLGFAMGSYQAYIGLAVSLTAICMIIKFINDEEDKYKYILRSFLSGIGGGLVYVIGLNICLKITGLNLYDRAATFSIAEIFNNLLPQLLSSYKIFFMTFTSYKLKRIYLFIIIFIIFILEIIGISLKLIKEKKYLNLICILFLFIIFPVCCNFIGIIMPNSEIHHLMVLPDYLLLFLIIYLKEYLVFDKKKIITGILSLCLLCLSWTLILSANATYDSYRLSYNIYKERFKSALDKVYDLEDYDFNETKIVVIGYPKDEVLRSNIHIYDYAEEIPEECMMYWFNELDMSPTITYNYLLNEFGIFVGEPMETEDYKWFVNSEKCKNMPSWPEKGYVQMIDGNAVIKFCEVYE